MEHTVSRQYVDHARTVLRWLPEVADLVMAGTKPLSEAYAEALQKKQSQNSDAQRVIPFRARAIELEDNTRAHSPTTRRARRDSRRFARPRRI
jgi:hypothetical protein